MDPYSGLTSGALLDGRYRVGALIARGGMSTVYRGVDTRLDRPVAIKVMSPHYVSDPAFLSRFEREARLAASLGHSGVVAMYDQGRDGDLVFLVMELVDGGTLRDLLRERGALSVPVTMSILEPLLAALGAAHAAGLVHRDVKPENVLISAQGAVKIADFGLVRAVTSQTMATGDVILGTVAYLSPEQVATGASDASSDVYSTGIVAYEMLTGQPPFGGDNPMSVAYQHVHSDVPPPSGRAIGTPDALDELIVAATRRDPSARPRDASAFLSALLGIRAQLGLRRVPVPVPQRRPAPPPMAAQPAYAAQVGASGTRVLAAGPVTVADPPPAFSPARCTSQSATRPSPPVRNSTAIADPSPTHRAAPPAAEALADCHADRAAARGGRGGRRLVAGRPLVVCAGRGRALPGLGGGVGPGRRTGPPGQHRASRRRAGRHGRRYRTCGRSRAAPRLRGGPGDLQRPAQGANHPARDDDGRGHCRHHRGRSDRRHRPGPGL